MSYIWANECIIAVSIILCIKFICRCCNWSLGSLLKIKPSNFKSTMSDLWAQDDPEKWQATLDKYWEIIDAIGKEKLPELERYDLFLKNTKKRKKAFLLFFDFNIYKLYIFMLYVIFLLT